MKLDLRHVRRALIVAPHPDDEIIGAAALIGALRRQGSAVQVVIVSDGAASHAGSLRWPKRRLVAERHRESRRALRRLAVPAGDITFLDLPDGAVASRLALCRRQLRRLAVRRGPNLVVAPAAEDGHPDHRAVELALRGAGRAGRRLSYQVWPPRAPCLAASRFVLMRGGAAAKRSLIRVHRTQAGAITDDPSGFTIAAHELAAFSHPVERFVEVRR